MKSNQCSSDRPEYVRRLGVLYTERRAGTKKRSWWSESKLYEEKPMFVGEEEER
jgi:hypothetical protein